MRAYILILIENKKGQEIVLERSTDVFVPAGQSVLRESFHKWDNIVVWGDYAFSDVADLDMARSWDKGGRRFTANQSFASRLHQFHGLYTFVMCAFQFPNPIVSYDHGTLMVKHKQISQGEKIHIVAFARAHHIHI